VKAVVLRWGFLLAALLFLLAVVGANVQAKRRALTELRAERAALVARLAELEAELAARKNPKRVLEWARRAGFVPLAEGRWRW